MSLFHRGYSVRQPIKADGKAASRQFDVYAQVREVRGRNLARTSASGTGILQESSTPRWSLTAWLNFCLQPR